LLSFYIKQAHENAKNAKKTKPNQTKTVKYQEKNLT
jgi:hypothetical protein